MATFVKVAKAADVEPGCGRRAGFDVTSGAELGSPAPRGAARYDVRIVGEDVTVEL
jgi:hypothetical protein